MKKYFLFAVAALTMVAACSKKEIQPAQEPDNSGAQAIRFNVDAPSLTVARTKAAVDAWNNHKIYVLGYERSTGDFDTTKALIRNLKTEVPASGELTLRHPEHSPYAGEPYFYAESTVYDFYGYYVDNAELGEITNGTEGFIVPLTITGTQDIMAAKADPEFDTDGTGVAVKNAYSAYAARRSVHPKLQFDHLLTRFRFHLVAGSDAAQNVVVTGIKMLAKKEADLKVAPEVKLTVKGNADTLTVADITEFSPYSEGWNDLLDKVAGYDAETIIDLVDQHKNDPSVKTALAGEIMVMPEELSHDLVVEFKVKDPIGPPEYYDQPFKAIKATLNAADVVTGKGNRLAQFEPGHQYDIVLKVYGPEEVKITAVLSAWEEGGHIDYDPDDYMEIPTAELTKATATSLTFGVAVPVYVQTIEAGLSTTGDAADVTNWKPVSYTKALAVNGAVQFDGLTEGTTYYFHMRYKKSAADEYEEVDEVIKAPASDFAILGYECVYATETEPTTLKVSWLDNGVDVAYVVKCGNEEKANGTISAPTPGEFEYSTDVTPGNWSIVLTRGEEVQTIPYFVKDTTLKVIKSYVVADESSYNLLPESYLTRFPWDENKESIAANDKLPWFAIEVETPIKSVEIVATNGAFTKTLQWVPAAPFDLITISAKELGLDTMTSGNWTVLVNDVPVNFTIQ